MPKPPILREPLLHFLVAGAVLFAIYAAINRGAVDSDEADGSRIVVGPTEIQAIESRWQNQWGREPTPAELTDLVNDYVREEALYRQAVAMGLDRDDTIVRRRMAQKMTFLIEGVAVEQSPSESTLRAWLADNQARYQQPAAVSFRHVYFSADRRGQSAADDARALLKQLDGLADDDDAIAAAGDRFMLKDAYDTITRQELSYLLGDEFADAVFALESGDWRGPVASSFGEHLVYVHRHDDARAADFDQVADRVASDWMRDQAQTADKEAMRELLKTYQVELDPDVAAQVEADRILGRKGTR